MKSYEHLLPRFSNEPGLEYVDKFAYQNNSVYRGQMKKVDEVLKQKLINMQSTNSDNASSHHSKGALQNRLSAKCDNIDQLMN